MKTPLISVLVANRNHEDYLGECLESILNQSVKELEVVLYDDASSDGSMVIAEEFHRLEPQRIQLLRGYRRKGPAHGRNQAARAARGHYLTTLDADDIFVDKDKLKRELKLLEGLFAKGTPAAAFSDVLETGTDRNLRRWSDSLEVHQGWIQTRLITRDGFIPRDFLFPRVAFFACGGYDSRLRTHEDWELKIRLAAVLPFYYTGTPGVMYRRLDSGLSRSCHHQRMCNLWRVYRRYRRCLKKEYRKNADRTFAQKMRRLEAASPVLPAFLRRWGCGLSSLILPRRKPLYGDKSGS